MTRPLAALLACTALACGHPTTARRIRAHPVTPEPTPSAAPVHTATATPRGQAAPGRPSGIACVASHYGRENGQHTTAYGQPNDPTRMGAASRTFARGTLVRVAYAGPDWSPMSGRSVVVTVDDVGPSRYWVRRGRCIDLTTGAMHRLTGGGNTGVLPVRVEQVA